jgi:hypothetical protein
MQRWRFWPQSSVCVQQRTVCAQSGRKMFSNDSSIWAFIRSVMSAHRRFSSCSIWPLHWQYPHVRDVSTCQTLATASPCEKPQAELWFLTWGLHCRRARVSQSRICLDPTILGGYCTQKMGHNVPLKRVYVFTETGDVTSRRQLQCKKIAVRNTVVITNSRKTGRVMPREGRRRLPTAEAGVRA